MAGVALLPSGASGRPSPTTTTRPWRASTCHPRTTPITRVEHGRCVGHRGRAASATSTSWWCATGYNLWDMNYPAIEVIGRDGRDLGAWWFQEGFQAFEAVAVPRLPQPAVWPEQPVLLQRAELLHDHRVADAAHGAALRPSSDRQGAEVFEVTERGQRAVPAADARPGGLHGLRPGGLCGVQQLLLQPPRGGDPLSLRPTSSADARQRRRAFPISDYEFA